MNPFLAPSRLAAGWCVALALAIALGPSARAADARTWTDTSGRTILAELMEATEAKVRIRRNDGRVFELPLTSLSEADRIYVSEWSNQRAFVFGGIEVRVRRVRLEVDRKESRSRITKDEEWCFKLTIANQSRKDFAGIRVDYRVFYRDDSSDVKADAELPRLRKTGHTVVPSLARGTQVDVQTGTVTLQHLEMKPGYRLQGSRRRVIEDSLAGIWVRITHDGEIIHEFADPTFLVTAETW